MEKISRWNNLSISLKTALIGSIVVISMLAGAAVFFMSMEASLMEFILTEYDKKIQNTFTTQAKQDEAALQVRHSINARISGGMASYFVYNFDPEGLKNNLRNLLQLPDVRAVQVQDSDGKPFVGLWKEGETIATGEKIGNDQGLDQGKIFTTDIIYDSKKIGALEKYNNPIQMKTAFADYVNLLPEKAASIKKLISGNTCLVINYIPYSKKIRSFFDFEQFEILGYHENNIQLFSRFDTIIFYDNIIVKQHALFYIEPYIKGNVFNVLETSTGIDLSLYNSIYKIELRYEFDKYFGNAKGL